MSALDALDLEHRHQLLAAARARLRRMGLPRTGDFPDHHPLLRGEAVNLRHACIGPADTTDASTTAAAGGTRPAVAKAAGDTDMAAQPSVSDPAVDQPAPGTTCAPQPVGEGVDVTAASSDSVDAQPSNAPDAAQPARPLARAYRRDGFRRARGSRAHRALGQRWRRSRPPSQPAAIVPDLSRRGAARVASRPRSRATHHARPATRASGASQTRGRRNADSIVRCA